MGWGFCVLILGGILVTLAPLSRWSGPAAVMGGVMVYMFGQTLVQPNAVATALDPLRHMAGMGSALIGIIQMLLGAVGGYAVNRLYTGTPVPMGAVILGAALSCSALYLVLLRHLRTARREA